MLDCVLWFSMPSDCTVFSSIVLGFEYVPLSFCNPSFSLAASGGFFFVGGVSLVSPVQQITGRIGNLIRTRIAQGNSWHPIGS